MDKIKDFTIGNTYKYTNETPITLLQIIKFAGACGDFNPIHVDESFAKEAGLPNAIAHGAMLMELTGQFVTELFNLYHIKKFSGSFKNITIPGDILTFNCTIKKRFTENEKDLIECVIKVTNQNENLKLISRVIVDVKGR